MTSFRTIILPNRAIAIPIVLGAFMALSGAARAEVFDVGSTFTDSGTNSPDSFSQNVTLAPGNTSLDNGALNLNIAITPTGDAAGDEWLVFTYKIASGPLAAQGNYWSIHQTGLTAAAPVNFVGAFDEFLDPNGNDLAPTSSVFGGNVFSNPVPGGVGIGQGALGFLDPIAAGPIGGLGAYITPFDLLDGTGIPSANVDGFLQALEFQPQTPPVGVPEPASFAMLASALLLMSTIRLRSRR